jgi:two-component system, chemotaxis family, CheB/CheR fusion protein
MPDVALAADFEQGAEDDKQPRTLRFPIVGIGASAGGLDAFSQLLAALPVDTGMAFVLIQHLDPAHESQLAEILSRTTTMPVTTIKDGIDVESNAVYVIPPNADLTINEGALRLTPRSSERVPHLPIDRFFESLAEEQRRLSIGVILSGNGSDGTQGLKAIKSQCGVTFVQKEITAKFDGMPHSAIASGAVDFVLSPAEIAHELARIGMHPYLVSSPQQTAGETLPDGEVELRKIFALVQRATGIDFTHYKQTTTRRRIGRRMIVHRSETLAEYLEYLQKHPEEAQELYKDLLISVTHFFRDPLSFGALTKHLTAMVRGRQPTDPFRVWVPGCATGEEVYSLAICLEEVFLRENVRPPLQLFGTDINELALGKARAGRYPEAIAQDVSPERLIHYFDKIEGQYRIRKTIRDCCIFAKQDVTRDPPFSQVDLISCRNVLIYLGAVLQKAVLPMMFQYSLKETGLLFLGPAESIGSAGDLFQVVDDKNKIFTRKAVPIRFGASFPISRHPIDFSPIDPGIPRLVDIDWQKQADQIIQSRYAPDGVIINQDLQIQQLRGRTGFYLQPSSGGKIQNLLLLAHASLQVPLREAVMDAMARNTAVGRRGLRIEHEGEQREINLEVIPISSASASERYYLVAFERTTPLPAVTDSHSPVAAPKPEKPEDRIGRLEHELAEKDEHLRSITQEHEAALEEQRASNEEISSANEELQSTNEELATAKEELQSAIEELTTVNEELQNRNHELGVLFNDLNNLFTAVDTPILMVDRARLLRRFTPAAERFLGVRAGDLGYNIAELSARTNVPEIHQLVGEVLDTLAVTTREMQDREGCWWSLTVRPYRTVDHRIEGAVLTFANVDSLKRSLQAAEESRDYADAIVETVRESLVVLSPDLRIERVNGAFQQTFQTEKDKSEGSLLYQFDGGQWDIPQLRHLLEDVLPSNVFFEDFDVEHEFPRIGFRSMSLNARRILLPDRSTQKILLAIEDVTERRIAERQLLRSRANLQHFGHIVAHDLQEPIHTVSIYTQLFARDYQGKLDANADQFITHIQEGVLRTQTMIQDLLAFAEAETPQKDSWEAVNVESALKEGLRNLHASIQDSGASIMYDGLPTISYSSRSLTQVLQNLIGNAIKYRREEQPQIQIETTRIQGEWVFSVRDNGIGFDQQYAESIFGMFKRLEGPKYPGSGIGLALCQRIVESFGGRIWAESERGVGSTFYFTIPV